MLVFDVQIIFIYYLKPYCRCYSNKDIYCLINKYILIQFQCSEIRNNHITTYGLPDKYFREILCLNVARKLLFIDLYSYCQ